MTASGARDISAFLCNFFGGAIDRVHFFEFISVEPDTPTLRTHIDDHHGVRITKCVKRLPALGTIERLFAGTRGNFFYFNR